jgi:hypothetical protein
MIPADTKISKANDLNIARTSTGLETSNDPQQGKRHRRPRSDHGKNEKTASQQQHGHKRQQQQSFPTYQRPKQTKGQRETNALKGSPLLGLGPASWAHLLSHPEPGCLLLAQGGPEMAFFDRAVILITSHSDSRGSVGFVLNKASPLKVSELQLATACPGFMETFGKQRLQIGRN